MQEPQLIMTLHVFLVRALLTERFHQSLKLKATEAMILCPSFRQTSITLIPPYVTETRACSGPMRQVQLLLPNKRPQEVLEHHRFSFWVVPGAQSKGSQTVIQTAGVWAHRQVWTSHSGQGERGRKGPWVTGLVGCLSRLCCSPREPTARFQLKPS